MAEITIAILVLVSNTFVLVAVGKFEYLKSTTHRLIASLAVADLLVAILGIPSAILLRIGEFCRVLICVLINIMMF